LAYPLLRVSVNLLKKIANHRVLAVNRGEKEKILTVKFDF
ncbi:hypothetical protein SS7213T_03030, partial [Staphylococcus simiae CCM 7213 = CCUG 51256]